MTKTLPRDLTSYDLLKALALVLMITDHVGHFFYPDEMWLRIMGRMCVPIWFFLIGFARTTEITRSLWIGGALVAVSALIAGQYILPLNILFTIIIIRLFRERFVIAAFRSMDTLRGLFFILFFLTFPTALLFEYGAMGMMFALFGYAVRNMEDVSKRVDVIYLRIYAAAALFSYYLWQGVIMPHVSIDQALVFAAGLVVVGVILWRFKPVVYTGGEFFVARSFIRIFQFMGRRTLEIYVAHVILFRLVCIYLYPEEYVFMAFKVLPTGIFPAF